MRVAPVLDEHFKEVSDNYVHQLSHQQTEIPADFACVPIISLPHTIGRLASAI
jgi:hypothetical protein